MSDKVFGAVPGRRIHPLPFRAKPSTNINNQEHSTIDTVAETVIDEEDDDEDPLGDLIKTANLSQDSEPDDCATQLEIQLEMLHHEDIKWEDGIPHIIAVGGIEQEYIDRSEPAYKEGGPVYQVVVNDEATVDVMVCRVAFCRDCRKRPELLDLGFPINTISMPYLHSSQIKELVNGDFEFVPTQMAYDTDIEASRDCFVLFDSPDGQAKAWVRVCDEATCKDCRPRIKAEADIVDTYKSGGILTLGGKRPDLQHRVTKTGKGTIQGMERERKREHGKKEKGKKKETRVGDKHVVGKTYEIWDGFNKINTT